MDRTIMMHRGQRSLLILVILLLLLDFVTAIVISEAAAESTFDQTYYPLYGSTHISVLQRGHQVELFMDKSSGAGFGSKLDYGSGFFRIRLKLPSKRSRGVITTFYLTSKPVNAEHADHDELDFEFLGNNGMPYTLSTNIITNRILSREQQFHLWFDPTADFHTYQLLWNQHQIVFFVDDIPIRVYKNIGVNYLSRPMHVEGTIWSCPSWVGPVDWNQAPFTAYFQGFNIDGCPAAQKSNPQFCFSDTPANYWNAPQYWQLNPEQQRKYEETRRKYMFYDYCTKRANLPECRK